MPLNEILSSIIGIVVPIVEACGAAAILLGVGRTVVVYVVSIFRGGRDGEMRSLRVRLGQSLVMGLEFQVAADILKTSVSPAWNDILFLAALIGLRTVLNFLLEYELKLLGGQRGAQEATSATSAASPASSDPSAGDAA